MTAVWPVAISETVFGQNRWIQTRANLKNHLHRVCEIELTCGTLFSCSCLVPCTAYSSLCKICTSTALSAECITLSGLGSLAIVQLEDLDKNLRLMRCRETSDAVVGYSKH